MSGRTTGNDRRTGSQDPTSPGSRAGVTAASQGWNTRASLHTVGAHRRPNACRMCGCHEGGLGVTEGRSVPAVLLGSSVERDAELTGEPQHFRHLGVELRLQVSKRGIVLVESGPGTVVLTGDEQVG